MADEDSVLSLSSVYLFGRLISDLQVAASSPAPGGGSLSQQLTRSQARLARIFSFSFEGAICDLARPALFLVHGAGEDVDAPLPKGDFARLARAPGSVSRTGVAWQDGDFASDMRVWIYDKDDHSMRMEVDTGTFEHILLDAELGSEFGGGRSGGGRSGGGRSGGGRSGGGRSGGGRSGG